MQDTVLDKLKDLILNSFILWLNKIFINISYLIKYSYKITHFDDGLLPVPGVSPLFFCLYWRILPCNIFERFGYVGTSFCTCFKNLYVPCSTKSLDISI